MQVEIIPRRVHEQRIRHPGMPVLPQLLPGRQIPSTEVEGGLIRLPIEVGIEDSGSVTTSRDSTDPSTWSAPGPPAVSISLQGNTVSESSLDLIQTLLAVAIPAHVTATLVDGKQ